MLNSITEDSNDLFNWKRKERIDCGFRPWMVGSNILTMFNPLFWCQIVQILSLLRSKLEWEKDWIGGWSILIHICSIHSGQNSSCDG